MKRKMCLLWVSAFLLLSAAGCSTGTGEKDYSNTTITGKVTAVEGTVVTLQPGELEEAEMTMLEGDGQTQSQEGESDTQGQPPAMPSGEASSGETQEGEAPSDMGEGGTPPEKPSGEAQGNGGTPPGDAPSDAAGDESTSQQPEGEGGQPMGGAMYSFTESEEEPIELDLSDAEITVERGKESQEGSMDEIAEDTVLVIEFGDNNTIKTVTIKSAGMSGQKMQMGAGQVEQGTAAVTLSEDGTYADETYTSSGDDENALRIDGAEAILENITVNKKSGSSSNTESGDFYGMNAALLATNGAAVTIKNAEITSSAQNGNGVFSYGEGTVVTVADTTISTTADNSGGIQTTGGGTTKAKNLTITTEGNSSAAIRSDRGGGTVNVNGGDYTSNGYNSPAVYSTADITVKNATLTANNSEALVVEGKNSITLKNCKVTGNMSDTEGTSSDENVHNVMIYQSMSGDADVGESSFSMTGGKLTSKNGDMFFITNTKCEIALSDVSIVNKEKDGYLMLVSGNSASRGWGTAGANGAQAVFTASEQTLKGDIAVDTISTLDMTLSEGSKFTGAINIIENQEGGTQVENNAVVTIEKGCTWKLTGDSTVTSLTNNGTIDYNGHTITLADGTVLK